MTTDWKRPVRDDQHGTSTGYTYGCRCGECRAAWSVYQPEHRASVDLMDRVFEALVREADMDGLATASGARLGEMVGVTPTAANGAVRMLAKAGRLTVVGEVGRGGTFAIQLPEDAA